MNGKTIFILLELLRDFTIVPSWEDYSKESEDELCIELDPEWLLVLEIVQQQVCV